MKNQIKTVKSRVILFLAVFALVIAVFALAFSFNLIYSFQNRIAVQAAEFNLQLVANLIEQDLRDLTALSRWCGYSSSIAGYFLANDDLTSRGMEAWHALNDQYINNRAGRYVRRLIVLDSPMRKFLQVGNSAPTSIPVTVYNLEKIFAAGVERNGLWQAAVSDPYMFGDVPVIPLMYPVYDPDTGGETGTVFLAAATNLITDKLNGYQMSGDSHLYLEMGGRRYAIEGDRIIPESAVVRDSAKTGRPPVSRPVRDGITLGQSLSPALPLSGAWPALAAGLGILIILLAVMAWGVNLMAREISGHMSRLLADEKNKRDLEYRMLQSQINPHFLYNTLNSIKWMAAIQNATGIVEITSALSRFLKTVSRDIRKVVPLGDELALLEDYLVIQKYRYGGSVSFEKQINDQALLDTPIPRFTLQPLVENAIFHGIEPKGMGRIILDARRQDGDVLVSLTDDGAGMSAEILEGIRADRTRPVREPPEPEASQDPQSRSVGIRNVDERLRYAFGEAYGLSIQSEPGSYTEVTIRLPGSPAQLPGAA
jgi:two-component system sensor histidine kinase YesM